MFRKYWKNLRMELENREVEAIIIPDNDPHFSKYPAKCWKYGKWISSFTGSTGTLTTTLNDVVLWGDLRYFIHVKKQLESTGIEMQKNIFDKLFDESWLKTYPRNSRKADIDAKLFPVNMFETLMNKKEMKWLNYYHRQVSDSVSPYPEKEEVEYFKTVMAAI
jgi:hypothetical protein